MDSCVFLIFTTRVDQTNRSTLVKMILFEKSRVELEFVFSIFTTRVRKHLGNSGSIGVLEFPVCVVSQRCVLCLLLNYVRAAAGMNSKSSVLANPPGRLRALILQTYMFSKRRLEKPFEKDTPRDVRNFITVACDDRSSKTTPQFGTQDGW